MILVLSVIRIVVLQLSGWLGPFIVVAPISDAMWLVFSEIEHTSVERRYS